MTLQQQHYKCSKLIAVQYNNITAEHYFCHLKSLVKKTSKTCDTDKSFEVQTINPHSLSFCSLPPASCGTLHADQYVAELQASELESHVLVVIWTTEHFRGGLVVFSCPDVKMQSLMCNSSQESDRCIIVDRATKN